MLSKKELHFMSVLVVLIILSIMYAIYINHQKHKDNYLSSPSLYTLQIDDDFQSTPSNWVTLCGNINAVYDKYTSFVLLCNEHNASYIGCACNVMFENINKPFIITTDNTALKYISKYLKYNNNEVVIMTKESIYRGNEYKGMPIGVRGKLLVPPMRKPGKMAFKPINQNLNILLLKAYPKINIKYMTEYIKTVNAIVFDVDWLILDSEVFTFLNTIGEHIPTVLCNCSISLDKYPHLINAFSKTSNDTLMNMYYHMTYNVNPSVVKKVK